MIPVHILDYSAPTFVTLCGETRGLMLSRLVFDHLPGTATTCDACRVLDDLARIVDRADHPAGGQ